MKVKYFREIHNIKGGFNVKKLNIELISILTLGNGTFATNCLKVKVIRFKLSAFRITLVESCLIFSDCKHEVVESRKGGALKIQALAKLWSQELYEAC